MRGCLLLVCLFAVTTVTRSWADEAETIEELPPTLLPEELNVSRLSCDESCSGNPSSCGVSIVSPIPRWGLTLAEMFPLRGEDASLENACTQPNVRRNWSLLGLFGYETFRGVADNGWQTNGVYGGFNFGTRLGSFSDWTGIGLQGGVTTGLYDWKGNAYRLDETRKMQQTFVTYGLFKRPTERAPFTVAFAQDWMATENATAWGLSLAVSQIRYRVGYATSASNEFGVLGAFRAVQDTTSGVGRGGAMPTANETVTTRPINHMSAYWHHKWSAGGGNTIISIGRVEDGRVNGDGSLGDFLATATANVPLSNTVGFVGNVMYMNPTASPGVDASHEDTWSFLIGVEFFPGRDARSKTIAGERWMPLLPVANNGAFLLDASAI
ncbi:MAG: DUF6666 family protein [Planctomycetota bacterium]